MNGTRSSQQGATLIIVLVFVLLVTIVATLAIRKSMTSLSIATNSQAQQLLFQSSQSYLLKLTTSKASDQKINASVFGMIGFATQSENIGHEIAFCYGQDMSNLFDVGAAGVNTNIVNGIDSISNLGKTQKLTQGFCNPSNDNNYNSSRNAVMTQVYVKAIQNTSSVIFGNFIEGTDHASVTAPVPIKVHVISVIPGLAKSQDDIVKCFSLFPADAISSTGTVTSCLQFYQIPFNSQVAYYQQTNDLS